MRLQHLTLNALIDAAYLCGAEGKPVKLFIVAPSRAGKTWAGKAIKEVYGVTYFNSSYSPTKYKEFVAKNAGETKLFIHDDTGRLESWNYKAFVAIWCMMADGFVDTRDFGSTSQIPCPFSFILLSTVKQYHAWLNLYQATGLYDRFLPIQLGLSVETRARYNKGVDERAAVEDDVDSDDSQEPDPRNPRIFARRIAEKMEGRISDTTHREAVARLSRYLTPQETEELVRIVRAPSAVYEI